MNTTIKLDIVIIGLIFFLLNNPITISYLNTYFPVKGIFFDNMIGIVTRTLLFMIFVILIDENKFPKVVNNVVDQITEVSQKTFST